MSNSIKVAAIALFLATALASADQMTYTITGTGSGYYGSQQFTNAAFTFTETVDASLIEATPPANPTTYTTAPNTTLSVNVSGFPATTAISAGPFLSQTTATAGIWKDDSTQFLTVSNPVFSTWNFASSIGPVSGTTWAYAAPLSLSTGQQLYFTSVNGVTFTANRIVVADPGQITALSMTPYSATATIGSPQTYTFTFADSNGPLDIQGVDVLFSDPNGDADACWVYLNRSTSSLSVYNNGAWSSPVPIGGAALTGNQCVLDTHDAGWAGYPNNQLTVTLPITMTATRTSSAWTIQAVAFNATTSTNYQKMGSVTVSPAAQPGFSLTITPNGPQGLGTMGLPHSTLSYTVNVVPTPGFYGPVQFGSAIPPNQNPLEFGVSFNPTSVTGAGSTTLTVLAMPATVPGSGYVKVLGQTPEGVSASVNTGPIYVSNAAPSAVVAPNPGSTANQLITLSITDEADVKDINGVNMLIAPSLDGRNACWVYSDGTGLWLATDDATSWMYAGALSSSTAVSNSQCTVGGSQTSATPYPAQNTLVLEIPVTFQPSFAGGKTVFLRTSNLAGFDSGYQPIGTWTVP